MEDKTRALTDALVRAGAIVGQAIRSAEALRADAEIDATTWEIAQEILSVLHDDLQMEPGDPNDEIARRWSSSG